MTEWVSRPKLSRIHKIQLFKLPDASRFPWMLLFPSEDGKTRPAQRYKDWHIAFQTALTIQDLRNREGNG